MKRIVLFLIIVAPLFSQEYYRSNSLAMELERIEPFTGSPVDSEGWLLEKRRNGNLYDFTLYKDGTAEKSFVREYSYGGVLIYSSESRGRQLREEVSYRNDGQLEKEIFYDDDGEIDRIKTYLYSDEGQLTGVELLEGSEEVQAFNYSIRPDGSLRAVSGTSGSSRNSYSGTLYMENRESGQARIISYHRGTGRLESLSRYESDELVLSESRTYTQDGILKKILIENIPDNLTTERIMNSDGQIEKEEIFKEKELISGTYYTYSDGLLSQVNLRSPGVRDKWIYRYDGDLLSEEWYYKKEILEEKKIYSGEETGTYKQELYDKGEVFMNVYYESEVKVKEEYITNGRIVRTREYPRS